MRYGIGDNNLLEFTAVESFDGVATQNAVCDNCERILCTLGDQHVRRFNERSACVGHVVDQDGRLASYISDQNHSRNLIRACSLLVNEGKAKVQAIGYRSCPENVLALVPSRSRGAESSPTLQHGTRERFRVLSLHRCMVAHSRTRHQIVEPVFGERMWRDLTSLHLLHLG